MWHVNLQHIIGVNSIKYYSPNERLDQEGAFDFQKKKKKRKKRKNFKKKNMPN